MKIVTPVEKLANHIAKTVGKEDIVSYELITEQNKERCVGCGRPSINSMLLLKTREGNEYKIPVEGCCYADFDGALQEFSAMKRMEEKINRNIQ